MDPGMERLDAAVHHFGKARQRADVPHVEAGIAQRLGGAARRDQLDPVAHQGHAKLGEAGLVRHGQQGAGNFNLIWQILGS